MLFTRPNVSLLRAKRIFWILRSINIGSLRNRRLLPIKRLVTRTLETRTREVHSPSIVCIILISARWPLSTSVAKLNSSASCPAPAVSNKSFTIIKAPPWC